MSEEDAKAVQEVARAASNAIDAAREASGFISRFVAGPLEQGMAIFEDRLKYIRREQQVRLPCSLDNHKQPDRQQIGLRKPQARINRLPRMPKSS